jgi:hypothetical protein
MSHAHVASFEEEIPPWGGTGYGLPFRPDLIPAVAPDRFARIVLFCLPRAWPTESPDYWSPPAPDTFGYRLLHVVGQVESEWTPINHRFFAMIRLLEAGTRVLPQLAPGPTHEEIRFHPAMLHTAAQLALQPDGRFDAVAFRQETQRRATTMHPPLPRALEVRLLFAAGRALQERTAPEQRRGTARLKFLWQLFGGKPRTEGRASAWKSLRRAYRRRNSR